MSWYDTFNVLSETSVSSRAVQQAQHSQYVCARQVWRVEPVELVKMSMSSQSSSSCQTCRAVLFDKFDTAKSMGSTRWTCWVVTSQVEFGLNWYENVFISVRWGQSLSKRPPYYWIAVMFNEGQQSVKVGYCPLYCVQYMLILLLRRYRVLAKAVKLLGIAYAGLHLENLWLPCIRGHQILRHIPRNTTGSQHIERNATVWWKLRLMVYINLTG